MPRDRFQFGVRHLQCLLLFLGLAVGYAMRVNLSVAIVAMTDQNATNPKFEGYNWSEQTKSYILSSFFWGYTLTQIPAGQMADKYGPKSILLHGTVISSILSIFTPLLLHFGNWKLLCLTRVIQGLSQGMLFPSTHAILSKWALVEERGALCGFCYTGTLFGAAVMFAISGFIASSTIGWPGIFYTTGTLGLAWVLIWSIWGANKPEDYENITIFEKSLIETSLGQRSKKEQLVFKTPWLKIFKTRAIWILTFVHCAHNWGFWTLLTELPTYMKEVMGTDMKQNALFLSLPYFTMLLLSFVFIFVSNKLEMRAYVSTATNRKLLNTLGQWIPALALIGLAYTNSEYLTLAVSLLILAIGINAASFSGFQVNHIDLSPNYAGVLMGITNCAANVMSIIAPLSVGILVTDESDPIQWRIIFFIAAGFYFLGNLLFIMFGKFCVPPWNEPMSGSDDVHSQSVEMQNFLVSA